jgi:DNA/RNA endonuclease G (NUC1)
MANMEPQTPDLNRQVWKRLEEDSRKLALKGNTLFILAGCYGNIGNIGNANTVIVPKSCWKMAAVEGPNPSVIIVDIPNKTGIGKDRWQKYATTLDDIEAKTGLHLTRMSAIRGIYEKIHSCLCSESGRFGVGPVAPGATQTGTGSLSASHGTRDQFRRMSSSEIDATH